MLNSSKRCCLLELIGASTASLQECVTFHFVMQALKSNSVVSLKKHKDSKCNAQCVLERWRKMHSSDTPAVLGKDSLSGWDCILMQS